MSDHPGHEAVICSLCNTTISQCRCPGPKTVTYDTCDKCKDQQKDPAPPSDVVKPQIPQTHRLCEKCQEAKPKGIVLQRCIQCFTDDEKEAREMERYHALRAAEEAQSYSPYTNPSEEDKAWKACARAIANKIRSMEAP